MDMLDYNPLEWKRSSQCGQDDYRSFWTYWIVFVPNEPFPMAFGTSTGTPCQDFEKLAFTSQIFFTRIGYA